MPITTVAVDLAKDVFQVALADRGGHVVERRRLTRRQFERCLDDLRSGTTVLMETCGTAHYWGRRALARGLPGWLRVTMSRGQSAYQQPPARAVGSSLTSDRWAVGWRRLP
ncbi:MAG: hypothetical protein GEU82_08705 [Luteitalea sp.]|nr:hypothetical protein [Luteitalea sp.]